MARRAASPPLSAPSPAPEEQRAAVPPPEPAADPGGGRHADGKGGEAAVQDSPPDPTPGPERDPHPEANPPPPPPERTGGGGFVPLNPPTAPAVSMPLPEGVLHQSDASMDAVPFEFADIRALAQRILRRAQEQGQQKLDAARKQIAAMEKEARDKGYKEAFDKGHEEGLAKGFKEGMAQAEKKIAAAIASEKESLRQNAAPASAALKELSAAVSASRAELIAQTEGDLLLLAIDLAKRLVGHELSVDPEAIKPLASECIGLVTDRTGITARVNPEDHRILEEYYPDLKALYPDLGPIVILPDQSIERGGVHIATREAEVDMRLATRLAAFEEVILGYSGEEAVAPWSRIPPEAIAAAREARSVSPYSLPGSEEPTPEPPPPEAEGAPKDGGNESDPDADSAMEAGGAGEAVPQPPDDPAPSPPQMDHDAPPPLSGDDSASPTALDEGDLSELVDLAAMADLDGDGENTGTPDGGS